MITLKDFVEAIDYKISGGSEYCWKCFGDNARYLDCDDTDFDNSKFHIGAVFDSRTQQVYTLEAWDYVNQVEYRWIDPKFKDQLINESKEKGVDHQVSTDRQTYIDLDVEEDILEKIAKIIAGEPYDSRVKVPLDIPDEDLLKYMIAAHERDMTFNEFIEEALRHAIDEYNRDPEGMKQRAKEWTNT
jgi:hypothetical protein